MARAIAEYFGQVGIRVDQTSLKSVDTYFKNLENKFKFYSNKLGKGLTLKVNFQANIRDLIRGIQAKLDPKGNGVGVRIRITPRIVQGDIGALRRQLTGGLANIPITVRYSGNFRQSLMNRINQAIAPARSPAARGSGGSTRGSGGGSRGSQGIGAPNLTTGVLGRTLRFGAGGLPFVGGAIGFNQLNQANTDFQSQKLAAEGIFAGKLAGGGNAARQQLFDLAQLNGFDYKETLPNFSRFMASSMPSLGYGGAFGTFRSITEFGRARGATGESMERALYAFSQIAGKGKVMSEELFGQLAEAAGFGESGDIFAQAFAQKTNSGLTGQQAQAALREAMKQGKVISSEILPLVAKIMSERAAPTLDKARETADARQMRFRNARNKFMERFSENGGEAGFAKFWDAVSRAMEKLADKAPQLAQAFEGLIDVVTGFTKRFLDINSALMNGYGNETTIAIQRETGINILAIRDGVSAVVSVLARIGESLGVGGSIAAIAGVYGLTKIGGKLLTSKVEDKLGSITGTANNLSAYSMPGMSAIRVFVVNGGSGFDVSPSGTGSNKSGGGMGPNDGPKKQGFLKKAIPFLTGLLGVAGGVYTLSEMTIPDFHALQPSMPYMSAFGVMTNMAMGGADSLTNKNISQVSPVVEQAAKQETNIIQDFNLKAEINITAQTGQEALDIFARDMEAKVFAPFMRQSLQEAQSTYSIYAR